MSPLVPNLRQINRAHTIPPGYSKINFSIIPCLHLSLPSGFFPSCFPTKILYVYMLATYSAHLIPLTHYLALTGLTKWGFSEIES
jgi:hypothetical protein